MTFLEIAKAIDDTKVELENQISVTEAARVAWNASNQDLVVVQTKLADLYTQLQAMMGVTPTQPSDMKALYLDSAAKARKG